MDGLVFTHDGDLAVLEALVAGGLHLCLFVDDHHPSRSDVGDIYTEPQFGGYKAFNLKVSDWIMTGGDGSPAQAQTPRLSFTRKGSGEPVTVCGYYVSQKAPGGERLICAERIDPPFVFANDGDELKVLVRLRGASPVPV